MTAQGERALAEVSALVVQLAPGVQQLLDVGRTATEQVAALTNSAAASFLALQVHMQHVLEQPAGEPVATARAPNRAKGGKARAASLSAAQRSKIARKAARTRWRKP